jgi:hypothetical protein
MKANGSSLVMCAVDGRGKLEDLNDTDGSMEYMFGTMYIPILPAVGRISAPVDHSICRPHVEHELELGFPNIELYRITDALRDNLDTMDGVRYWES